MNINRKQLAALFICSLVPWVVGNGLLPLLPVYAVKLGADSTVAGLYLAFSYLAIALGSRFNPNHDLPAGLTPAPSDRLRCGYGAAFF